MAKVMSEWLGMPMQEASNIAGSVGRELLTIKQLHGT